MSWYQINKQTRQQSINRLRITRKQQQDFLKNYAKLSGRQISEFKSGTVNSRLLKPGKSLSDSEFSKLLIKHDPALQSRWRSYLKVQDKKYNQFLESEKRFNIKKTIKLDQRRGVAREVIDKFGAIDNQKTKKSSWRDKYRSGEYNLSRSEQRVESVIGKFINPKRTEWNYADNNKVATIHDVIKNKIATDKSVDSKSKEYTNITNLKEQSKKLPDLKS